MRPLNLNFFFLKLCILEFFWQPPILKKVEKNRKRSGQLQHPTLHVFLILIFLYITQNYILAKLPRMFMLCVVPDKFVSGFSFSRYYGPLLNLTQIIIIKQYLKTDSSKKVEIW